MAKEKERVLTKKEQARAERVEKITAELAEKGYVRSNKTISILYANIMALVYSIPFIVVFGIIFWKVNDYSFSGTGLDLSLYWIFLLLVFVLIVVHELIHGITWAFFAPNHFKSIEFGFMVKELTPYCTCGEPLSKAAYILGSFMPCLLLGIIPSIIAITSGSMFWFLMGCFMFLAAGGDITIIIKMLRYHSPYKDVIILDHPTECGFIVFEK